MVLRKFVSNRNEEDKSKNEYASILGMSTFEISKTLTYEFWYNFIKLKYQNNPKLCYMDTDSFIIQMKTEDFYKDIADVVVKWFDTSNYSEDDKDHFQEA